VIKSKTGVAEFQFLNSFKNANLAKECYKMRWQIETMFKVFKCSGLNLEDTHLKDMERIKKLASILCVVFCGAT